VEPPDGSTEVPGPPQVFISYAHESESDIHGHLVRQLWRFLRSHGIDAHLDVSAAAQRLDWALWMADQIRQADHILVIASPAYRSHAEGHTGSDRGRGVRWEARLIRDAFYSDQHALNRFVPVILPGQTADGIPDFLGPATTTVYHIHEFTVSGAEPLLRLLTRQPAHVEPPLGPRPTLPVRSSRRYGDLYLEALADHGGIGHVQYDRDRPVFVQYLNPEILAAYGRPLSPEGTQISLGEALHATRTAVLATDAYLVIPASYLFEVRQLSDILLSARELTDFGLISYCSPASDLSVYGEQKLAEYRSDTRNPYKVPKRPDIWPDLQWRPRQQFGTTDDIKREWTSALGAGGQLTRLTGKVRERWPASAGDIDTYFRDVPELLAGRAFITRFVSQSLPVPLDQTEKLQVDLLLSKAYLKSYLADTDSILLTDFAFGSLTCGLNVRDDGLEGRLISSFAINLVLKWLGIYEFVHGRATWSDLIRLRAMAEFGFVVEHSQNTLARQILRRAIVRCHAMGDLDQATTSLASTMHAVEVVSVQLDAIAT
jgi:TIR domain